MSAESTVGKWSALATAALVLAAAPSGAQITASLLDEETDIVNTGGTLVSACHFQAASSGDPDPLVVNGVAHTVGRANVANLTQNMFFEGDFRNGGSGLPQDGSDIIQVLLSGIAGANPVNMSVSGLTVGTEYLFQAYWEADLTESLTITIEGDTVNLVPAQKPGVLISYQFTAGDDTLDAFFDRDDGGTANNWLSGYSLQAVAVSGNPVLTGTDPADDATLVPTKSNLVATFDKTVQAPTVGTGNITLYKADDTLVEAIDVTDVTAPGTVSFNGALVTIDPSAPLVGGVEYYVLIDATAITDNADSPYAGISDKTAWTFTADGTAPTKTGMSPVADAMNVLPTADLTITFDEGVGLGSGNITIKLAGDDTDAQVIDVTSGNVVIDGANVTISLPTELDLSTAYYVNIDSGAFLDPSGNAYAGIDDSTTWAFTTAASNPFTISLLDEESDILNTGGTLVSAVHFQAASAGDPDPLVVNGIPHTVGSGSDSNLSDNFFFEGDFRNGGSGLPQDGSNIIQVLLSGIAGANPVNMSVSGLTAGKEYLLQAYWEADLSESLTITVEGDTITMVPAQKPGVLISYQFTAGDDTLDAFFDRDDGGTANNWLSGFSLQEVPSSVVSIKSITPLGGGQWELTLQGASNTGYEFLSSPVLDFDPGLLVEDLTPGVPAIGAIGGTNNRILTTDSNGEGAARMSLAGAANFVVARIPPPVTLLEESFDTTTGPGLPSGWTTGRNDPPDDGTSSTSWEVGTPVNVGPVPPGVPLPSGSQCVGTDIDANYFVPDPVGSGAPVTDIWLRTPAIPLGSAAAGSLSFQQWTEIEEIFDYGSIRILDASDDSELVLLEDQTISGDTSGWVEYAMDLPAEAFTAATGAIKIEFRFEADDLNSFAGWYIDDVLVVVPGS